MTDTQGNGADGLGSRDRLRKRRERLQVRNNEKTPSRETRERKSRSSRLRRIRPVNEEAAVIGWQRNSGGNTIDSKTEKPKKEKSTSNSLSQSSSHSQERRPPRQRRSSRTLDGERDRARSSSRRRRSDVDGDSGQSQPRRPSVDRRRRSLSRSKRSSRSLSRGKSSSRSLSRSRPSRSRSTTSANPDVNCTWQRNTRSSEGDKESLKDGSGTKKQHQHELVSAETRLRSRMRKNKQFTPPKPPKSHGEEVYAWRREPGSQKDKENNGVQKTHQAATTAPLSQRDTSMPVW